MMGFNSKAESDWDADVDYERKEWLAVRQSELVNLGYHPATAYVVAVREWNALLDILPALKDGVLRRT